MPKSQNKNLFVSLFGGLAYLSILAQWAWLAIVLLPPLLDNESIRSFLLPEKVDKTTEVIAPTSTSPLMAIIATVIIILVIGVCTYILLKLPITVAKNMRNVGVSTSNAVLPIITQHKKISEKKKRHLSAVILWWIKLTAIILPILLCWLTYLFPIQLPAQIVILTSFFLGIVSLVWLLCEYILAKLLGISLEKVF